MKIINSSSLPTSNIRPTVARRTSARYSPGCRGAFSACVSRIVKNASAKQMILNSDVSGEITSIPPNSVSLRGKNRTATIAITIPSAATNTHAASARFAIRPIESTTRAVTTTTASGDASLRSSRYDMVKRLKRCSAKGAVRVSFQKSHRFNSGHDAVQKQLGINADGDRCQDQHARADFLRNCDRVELFPIQRCTLCNFALDALTEKRKPQRAQRERGD